MKKLLVVDDVDVNRIILTDLFEDEFEVLEAENGQEALDILKKYGSDIAVVLLDIIMPIMDGFGVLESMEATGLIETVPVILITGEHDDKSTLKGYKFGVADIINKPFNSDIVHRRVNNVVSLYSHKQNLEMKLQEQKEIMEEQSEKIRQSNLFVIDALSTTVEFRSCESGEHITRVRNLTRMLLLNLKSFYNLSDEEIETISNASALHDIGKIAIPDSILLKPGRLTKEEFDIMKTHTTRGCEILESLNYAQDRQYYKYCYEICRHHHERWDGNGYPDGLKGDEISIWAQATALADVYDALSSKRVYKDAFSHKQSIDMIANGECGVFNPKLIESFLDVADMLLEQYQSM